MGPARVTVANNRRQLDAATVHRFMAWSERLVRCVRGQGFGLGLPHEGRNEVVMALPATPHLKERQIVIRAGACADALGGPPARRRTRLSSACLFAPFGVAVMSARSARSLVLLRHVGLAVLVASIVAVGWQAAHRSATSAAPVVSSSVVAPDFSLQRIDAQGVLRRREYAGSVLLVNLWVSWC